MPIGAINQNTYTFAATITPSDSQTQTTQFRAIYVGGAGNLKVNPIDGQSGVVTFNSVPAGTIIPIAVSQVFSTGTTATNLIGLM